MATPRPDFSQDSEVHMDTWKHTLLLSFQSLGVIYGHLSIGPLYVFYTVAQHGVVSEENLYGLMSFIFWTMTLIPLIKYVLVVLRADDNGEGGTFALYSLLCRHAKVGLLPNNKGDDHELLAYEMGSFYKSSLGSKAKRAIENNKSSHYLMLLMALLGSCMIIGNGVLVPAISVLSASINLEKSLASISFKYMSVSISCPILVGLFVLQHYGTHKIGFLFAPVMVVWLLFISGVGVYNIFHWNTDIIRALSPEYMYKFIKSKDIKSWRSLGGILLCIAGSEAMFADLGHFSKRSIKIAFGLLVYPSLIFCYMGQTAFISKNWNPTREAYVTHLGASVPGKLHHFYAWLSLLASVVGSQATITATFSIINQCQAFGCFPKVKVVRTSDKIHGQVYIPDINWILMVLCLILTIATKNVAPIGNATGLAIITSMLITTCFMSLIISLYWNRPRLSAFFLIFFGSIEVTYFLACVLNFHWSECLLFVPIQITLLIMLSWHYGTMKKHEFDLHNKVSIEWLTNLGPSLGVARVPGMGFIYTDVTSGIPAFFSHFVTNLPAFHQVLIFASFKSVPVPYVPPSMRYIIGRLGPKDYRVYRCIVRCGYLDRIRDIDDTEDEIICGIGEFISMDNGNSETLSSPEDKLIVTGSLKQEGNGCITQDATDSTTCSPNSVDIEYPTINSEQLQIGQPTGRTKKVRFVLPPESPQMTSSVREELQELVDAREHGMTYILGHSHISSHKGSNFLKRFTIKVYSFLVKNSQEHTVVLNIPNAAYVEVGMTYSI
ncbi:potassium transporter 25-like [Phoenix dactylifera]|uniref:Potassium transporter n=1 Tax=Phoenix dactylifera TaxID=42345 RepID=A0A8B9AP74_PHODC|nr:potassium transporter 25-like [Phoenix dactylifera]